MKRCIKRTLCLLLSAVILLLMFAGCGTGGKTYEGVEYTGEVASDNFALLFNGLGYEQKGTKRAFVRSIEYVDPSDIGSNSLWTLLNDKNEVVLQGELEYTGLSYGLQLWEIDFSSVTKPGGYRLIAEITDDSYTAVYQEASTVFKIQNRVYSNNVLLPLTLYNSQAREAPSSLGGGLYDCNEVMGEAYSHGIFLNGLVQTYVYQRAMLEENTLKQLEDAASRSFDYLVNIHDDETGEFIHSYPGRYLEDINLGCHNTIEALYGFCSYLYYFSDIDPQRASQANYERAVKTVDYLDVFVGPEDAKNHGYYYQEYLIPVCYYLYRYSGDTMWYDRGIRLIDNLLDTVDIRTIGRSGAKGIPIFEGVYLFSLDMAGTQKLSEWTEKLVKIKDTYYSGMGERNAFAILPLSEEFMATKEWDEMWRLPVGAGEKNWQLTTGRACQAMDACFLGILTKDKSLEEIAAGEIGYIFGLNPGFDGELVLGANSERPISSGALIYNLDIPRVRGWFWWGFTPKNDQWASIMNGFRMENGRYSFKDETTDDWMYGESFIKHDGAFAYAMCIYELYVNQTN